MPTTCASPTPTASCRRCTASTAATRSKRWPSVAARSIRRSTVEAVASFLTPTNLRRAARSRLRPGAGRLRQLPQQGRADRLVPAPQAAADRGRLRRRAHRSDAGARARPVAHRARRDAGAGAQEAARRVQLPEEPPTATSACRRSIRWRTCGIRRPTAASAACARRSAASRAEARLRRRAGRGDAHHRHVRVRGGGQGAGNAVEAEPHRRSERSREFRYAAGVTAMRAPTAMRNRRSALAVVAAASSSASMPRSRGDHRAAPSASRAGSLRWPRMPASGWSGASVSSSRYSSGIVAASWRRRLARS